MKQVALVGCLLLVTTGGLVQRAAADSHTGTIEEIQLSGGSQFVNVEATFKETGEGSSRVAVWVEVYDGPSGGLKGTLGRRTATTSCDPDRTCWSTLASADVPVLPGECYVGWGSIDDGSSTSQKRSPSSGRRCP